MVIHTYLHTYIQTYIHTSIHQYISTSINHYISTSVHQCIITSLHQYINTSIHQYINKSIHQYISTSMHHYIITSVHRYINTSVHQYINTSMHQYINTSVHQYINTSIHHYINTSIHHQYRCPYRYRYWCRYQYQYIGTQDTPKSNGWTIPPIHMAIWGSRFSNIAVVASCQTHSGITGNWFSQRFFQWTLPFSTVLAKHMSRFSRLNWSFLNNHHFFQLPTISSDQKIVTQPSTGRIGDIGTRRFQVSRRSLASFLCRLEVRPWNKIVLISQNPSKTTQKPTEIN